MKLLFAIKHLDSAVGGAERVLCTVCSDLADRGHDVTIVTFDQPGGKPFYELDSRIRLVDLHIGNAAGSSGIFDTIKRILILRQYALWEKPDVAVGFMHSIFVPLAFALVGTGVPAVGSEHIVPEHYISRRFEFFLLKIAARFLKKITVLSETIRASYPPQVMRKMVVMPNPVKKPLTSAITQPKLNRRTLLNVGRLDEQKDQATLINAFGIVADDFPDWNLKIVGMGPLYEELRSLIKIKGLEGRVVLSGVTSEIDNEYQAANIFIISSTYESFGLVTAEAMSHGLPVIGFADCPGTNKLIQDGETGILVDPKDDRVRELAAAISNLITNQALQEQFGAGGASMIKKQFSSVRICDQWESLLASLASKTA